MIADHVRRFAVLMIGLALVLSPLAQAGAAMGQSVEMSALGMSDMAMPEDCGYCGDGDGISAGACFASCAVPGIILSPTALLVGETCLTIVALSGTAATDRHPPPDPYPPKSS